MKLLIHILLTTMLCFTNYAAANHKHKDKDKPKKTKKKPEPRIPRYCVYLDKHYKNSGWTKRDNHAEIKFQGLHSIYFSEGW